MEGLSVSCRLTVPEGELEINDGTRYKLSGDTGGSISVAWRRQSVSSPYVHGTFTVSSVMDTVMETVGVYVYGTDNGSMREHLRTLTEAFTQHDYTATWDFEDDSYTWLCQRADYAVDTRREFRHARMALVNFQVPRYPMLIGV